MAFPFDWTADAAFNAAQMDNPALHELSKHRLGGDGTNDSVSEVGFFIDYPTAGSGPGAFGSPNWSFGPGGAKGYSFPGFARPDAIPTTEPGGNWFDPADQITTVPRIERRWSREVPDVATVFEPDLLPMLVVQSVVGGFHDWYLPKDELIETFYPVNDWLNFGDHGAPTDPSLWNDPTWGLRQDIPQFEQLAPVATVELPGGRVIDYMATDAQMWSAYPPGNLGANFYGQMHALVTIQLPRSAIGQRVAVREQVITPARNSLTPYRLATFNRLEVVNFLSWDPSVGGPLAPPGVIAAGNATNGRRMSPRTPRGRIVQ